MIYENDFKQLAYYLVCALEGDDVHHDVWVLLRKHDFVDEDGFWKDEE